MPTPVTITTAAIQYGSDTTECHCTLIADTIAGPSTVAKMVVLDSATLPDDWTDDELCAAVAATLDVDVADVSVAAPPAPPAPAPAPEPEGDA
jgi:hypothetical protein